MLRITQKIEGLSPRIRSQVGVDGLDGRLMHVVEDLNFLHLPEAAERYNVRQEDGTIRKITVLDHCVKEEVLKRVGGKYEKVHSRVTV